MSDHMWQDSRDPGKGTGVNELQRVHCHGHILLYKSCLSRAVLAMLGEVLSCMHTCLCAQQLHFDRGPAERWWALDGEQLEGSG